MKWCIECGAAGKPEPATTTVEGDPLCIGHARARGAAIEKPVFNAAYIDRRMTAFKKQPEEMPSAPREKTMTTKVCACGCGADMNGSPWNYKRGHKPQVGGGALVSPPRRKASGVVAQAATAPAILDLGSVDLLWSALTTQQKKLALHALLDTL